MEVLKTSVLETVVVDGGSESKSLSKLGHTVSKRVGIGRRQ